MFRPTAAIRLVTTVARATHPSRIGPHRPGLGPIFDQPGATSQIGQQGTGGCVRGGGDHLLTPLAEDDEQRDPANGRPEVSRPRSLPPTRPRGGAATRSCKSVSFAPRSAPLSGPAATSPRIRLNSISNGRTSRGFNEFRIRSKGLKVDQINRGHRRGRIVRFPCPQRLKLGAIPASSRARVRVDLGEPGTAVSGGAALVPDTNTWARDRLPPSCSTHRPPGSG